MTRNWYKRVVIDNDNIDMEVLNFGGNSRCRIDGHSLNPVAFCELQRQPNSICGGETGWNGNYKFLQVDISRVKLAVVNVAQARRMVERNPFNLGFFPKYYKTASLCSKAISLSSPNMIIHLFDFIDFFRDDTLFKKIILGSNTVEIIKCIKAKGMSKKLDSELYMYALSMDTTCFRYINSDCVTPEMIELALSQDLENIRFVHTGYNYVSEGMLDRLANEFPEYPSHGHSTYERLLLNLKLFPKSVRYLRPRYMWGPYFLTLMRLSAPEAYAEAQKIASSYTSNISIGDCPICITSDISVEKCDVCTMTMCSDCISIIGSRECPQCKQRFSESSDNMDPHKRLAKTFKTWLSAEES